MSDVKNLRFGVCNVCLKPICQCPKPKAPHALTREQVEGILNKLKPLHVLQSAIDKVLEHDAALRQALAQQAQEVERIQKELDHHVRQRCYATEENLKLKQEVERLKAEKADLIQRNQILRTRPDLPMTNEDKAAFKRLEQQLAAAQARVRELEERLRHSREDF